MGPHHEPHDCECAQGDGDTHLHQSCSLSTAYTGEPPAPPSASHLVHTPCWHSCVPYISESRGCLYSQSTELGIPGRHPPYWQMLRCVRKGLDPELHAGSTTLRILCFMVPRLPAQSPGCQPPLLPVLAQSVPIAHAAHSDLLHPPWAYLRLTMGSRTTWLDLCCLQVVLRA